MGTKRNYAVKLYFLLVLSGICFAADVPQEPLVGNAGVEDLSACKMPHGITELPKKDSLKARDANGYIFNFASQILVFDPLLLQKKRPETFQQFRNAVIEAQSGDLYFDFAENQSFFVSFSNRIHDLGKHFLYEFNEKKLSEPDIPSYTEEGETIKGILAGIQPGHCYLMTTLKKDWVLFRITAVDDTAESCTIQWVKRPAEAKVFTIPKSKITESKEPIRPKQRPNKISQELSEEVRKLREAAGNFRQKTEQFLTERDKLVEDCITILKVPDTPNADKSEKNALLKMKISAVQTLGRLRATEAAPLLASIIDARIPICFFSYADTIGSTFGCVEALEQIGKPGAKACIEEIVNLDTASRGAIKENLFSLVLVNVEGEKVATLLLSEEMKKVVSDKNKIENIERALLLITKVDQNFSYKIEEN